ncbi:MAG: acyl-CoA desaturase [Planctomycetes bacterium]|nr:acyl-CoA desaturase [Planctomycetota bacterium]
MIQTIQPSGKARELKVDPIGSIPFALVHLAALAVVFTGFSWPGVAVCVFLYVIRMFAITGAYHRYFSHRSYKTSRWFQFVLAFWGTSAAQKGPLWWAAHHRHHHRHSDTDEDLHSPGLHGLWWAHVGWITSTKWNHTDYEGIKDFSKFPELRWINRQYLIAPLLLGLGVYGLGFLLESTASFGLAEAHPILRTTASQMLIVGFFMSTVFLYHGTFCINSFAHLIGAKRYKTGDESKNSLILALITLGEGWHNNHHYYPGSERQGFFWWEIDITHYGLKALSWLGMVWELNTPAPNVLSMGSKGNIRIETAPARPAMKGATLDDELEAEAAD